MSFGTRVNSIMALVAGLLLSIFGKSPAKPTTEDLQHAAFKTSTQHLGIRFTERIRDVFRFRWLRRS